MKMKNNVFAMANDAPAIPVKPNMPAINPIARNRNAHLSTTNSPFWTSANQRHPGQTRVSNSALLVETHADQQDTKSHCSPTQKGRNDV